MWGWCGQWGSGGGGCAGPGAVPGGDGGGGRGGGGRDVGGGRGVSEAMSTAAGGGLGSDVDGDRRRSRKRHRRRPEAVTEATSTATGGGHGSNVRVGHVGRGRAGAAGWDGVRGRRPGLVACGGGVSCGSGCAGPRAASTCRPGPGVRGVWAVVRAVGVVTPVRYGCRVPATPLSGRRVRR
ncbi:hypothetical protein DDJ31_09965 [Streptomyces griseoviridis]|uniref:Uncharacterized protein n=1 Tax=Streptomyces griseoviridis TaxID=45398 RepID=A0ABX5TRN5_STRGD|nr:hypothetical protein DDJ31_09965 [Streptomyces griseoviridis]